MSSCCGNRQQQQPSSVLALYSLLQLRLRLPLPLELEGPASNRFLANYFRRLERTPVRYAMEKWIVLESLSIGMVSLQRHLPTIHNGAALDLVAVVEVES